MPTMSDVAAAAGVSTATVSRVLNGSGAVTEETIVRVMQAVTDLGYTVSASASGLASGRSRNVGVVVPNITEWYFASVVSGASLALRNAHYDLTLYCLDDSGFSRSEVLSQSLFRDRVDGFIFVSQEASDTEIKQIQAQGKPIVGVGGPLNGVHTFCIDDHQASVDAVNHLVALGHRRIGLIAGPISTRTVFDVSRQRQQGYSTALEAAGLSTDASLTVTADFTVAGGRDAARRLLDNERPPTAIFASSDLMAIGAIIEIESRGHRVGQDISVIGIDGHELGEVYGLTTVAQAPVEHGQIAASLLLDLMGQEQPPSLHEHRWPNHLHTRLLKRASTAPAPQRKGTQ